MLALEQRINEWVNESMLVSRTAKEEKERKERKKERKRKSERL